MTRIERTFLKPDGSRCEALLSVAHEIAERLGWGRDESVQAAFVIGSVTSGDVDDPADLDVVAVTDPVPSQGERLRRYRLIGCSNVMLDFFHATAPGLPSNVAAIDKVMYRNTSVDLCFCSLDQVQVYAFQNIVALKPSSITEKLRREEPAAGLKEDLIADRIRYDLRIIEVHRRRYLEHCRGANWLEIDLALLLAAIRDVLMVLNGVWRYNAHSRTLWRRLAKTGILRGELLAAIEDIKQLDDRAQCSRKLSQIDRVMATLCELCAGNGVRVGNYHADEST